MFFIKDQFAKLWSVDLSGTYPKGRISTSEKDREGNYDKTKTSNWFVTFFGDAKDKAGDLEGTERIKILSGKITNISKKQPDNTYKTWLNVIVFDFEVVGGGSPKPKQEESVQDEEEFPF